MKMTTLLMALWVFIVLHSHHVSGVKNRTTKLAALRLRVDELESEMYRLDAVESELQDAQDQLNRQGNQASLFVRWGRISCTSHSEQVYSGLAAGKHYRHAGSGPNRLCLSKEPQLDSTAKPRYYGLVYGAEYQYFGSHHDHEVPCSVCRTPHATTLMIPATLTCPAGWTQQYSGHLAGSYYRQTGSEFVCMDKQPENAITSNKANQDGNLFYYVLYACGSLPCGPFVNHKVITCVVCSK